METLNPNARRLVPGGGWEVTDIIDGHLVRRIYLDWTKWQAIALFKREMRLKREGATA